MAGPVVLGWGDEGFSRVGRWVFPLLLSGGEISNCRDWGLHSIDFSSRFTHSYPMVIVNCSDYIPSCLLGSRSVLRNPGRCICNATDWVLPQMSGGGISPISPHGKKRRRKKYDTYNGARPIESAIVLLTMVNWKAQLEFSRVCRSNTHTIIEESKWLQTGHFIVSYCLFQERGAPKQRIGERHECHQIEMSRQRLGAAV